jgi:hypothetical protein
MDLRWHPSGREVCLTVTLQKIGMAFKGFTISTAKNCLSLCCAVVVGTGNPHQSAVGAVRMRAERENANRCVYDEMIYQQVSPNYLWTKEPNMTKYEPTGSAPSTH